MDNLVDIIIPAYNASEFIANTIDSIPSHKGINIIIVNDGSIDNTSEIIESIKEKRNIIYIEQENKGEAGARNTGLNYIRSKYVFFLDADDQVIKNEFTKALVLLENEDYDALAFGYIQRMSNDKTRCYKYDNRVLNIRSARKIVFNRTITLGVCNSFYRSDILKEFNIKFSDFKYGADNEFSRRYLAYCKGDIYISDKYISIYNYNPNSIMRQKFSLNRIDSIKSVLESKRLYRDLNIEINNDLDAFLVSEIKGVYTASLLSDNYINLNMIISYLDHNIKLLRLYNPKRKIWSLSNMLFYFSPKIYSFFIIRYKNK